MSLLSLLIILAEQKYSFLSKNITDLKLLNGIYMKSKLLPFYCEQFIGAIGNSTSLLHFNVIVCLLTTMGIIIYCK